MNKIAQIKGGRVRAVHMELLFELLVPSSCSICTLLFTVVVVVC